MDPRAACWSATRLPADRVHVAPPGVDPAPLAPGSAAGDRLLCVAAVTPHKGHDVLVDALATLAEPALDAASASGALDPGPGLRATGCATGSTARASPTGSGWSAR